MDSTVTPSPDESWAYRAHQTEPLVEVVVEKIGTRKPLRTQVRFVDAAFEGLIDWVPPGRLKVPWSQAAEYEAREQQWDAVRELAGQVSEFEMDAAETAFDKLVSEDLATLSYHSGEGLVMIHDVARLASLLGLSSEDLCHPLGFVEDGDWIQPWPITRLIATTAAERKPDPLMIYLEREEADARLEAVYGRDYGGRRPMHISAEICAQGDEERGRPVREILRRWCGSEAVDRREELVALRVEVLRLGNLVELAAGELRRRGANREADALQRDLGIPVEELRRKS
jgi:hypothetical protein